MSNTKKLKSDLRFKLLSFYAESIWWKTFRLTTRFNPFEFENVIATGKQAGRQPEVDYRFARRRSPRLQSSLAPERDAFFARVGDLTLQSGLFYPCLIELPLRLPDLIKARQSDRDKQSPHCK